MKKRFILFPPLLPVLCWLIFPGCDIGLPDGSPVEKAPASGRVLEYGTLKPITGARVWLSDCTGEVLSSLNCFTVDSTLSGSDGRYAFSQTGFQTNARKDGYFTDFTTVAQVLAGKEDKADIILPPYAWLKVKIKNESGAYVIYIPNTGLNSGAFYLSKEEEKEFLIFNKGNQEFNFIFSVYAEKNGPIQNFDSLLIVDGQGHKITPDYQHSASPRFGIYLAGHDTTTYTIHY